MSLLCICGQLLGNDDSSDVFFTTAHTHWNTLAGKSFLILKVFQLLLIFVFVAMTKKGFTDETEELLVANLSLLNLVLSHWFKPAGGHGDPVGMANHEARLLSLEEKMVNSETTCASDLCTVLLSVYDSNMLSHSSGHKSVTRKCLVSHTLAVLLACSESAKATALKGICCVCFNFHGTLFSQDFIFTNPNISSL